MHLRSRHHGAMGEPYPPTVPVFIACDHENGPLSSSDACVEPVVMGIGYVATW